MANFKKDLFISYAHIDNQPLTPEQKDRISRFHASLEALNMRLSQATKIWRDDKLQGDDVFSDEIVDQFTHPRRTRFCPDAAQEPEFAYTKNHGHRDNWHTMGEPVTHPRPGRFPARVRLAFSLAASILAGVGFLQQLQDGV